MLWAGKELVKLPPVTATAAICTMLPLAEVRYGVREVTVAP